MANKLVHLVDDDDAVRKSLGRLLVSGGYDVKEYRSGDAFLNSLNAIDHGLILLDINMPGKDGYSVLQTLSNKGYDLPAIMMTGSGDLTLLALKSGAVDLMQKPFGRSELLSTLERVSTRNDSATQRQ
ncbi:MAG: hypothetical protein A3J40_05435 [Erythrobacter sp. RIFCSPHIGHO2_12_FULL_63_10]|nr:MAG: hypothetical protein A3J40_05435 [Erythrobacter sp. RIFCSPHIGHO2_12_FULL_63_10]